jgi:hypothetical protein
MRLVLRITLPDAPGVLSAVTAALGSEGADIASLEVIGRDDGVAVDDLCVESPVGPSHLRRALVAVPGVVVEAIRGVDRFRDAGAAVSLAADLVDALDDRARLDVLLEGLPAALWATWAAAVTRASGTLRVLAAAGGAPDLDGLPASWLPGHQPRALDLDEVLAPADREPARRGRLALAVALVDHPGGDAAHPAQGDAGRSVLVARAGGPSFRPGELHALGQLARIAGRAGGVRPATRLSGRAGRPATAGRS